MVTVCCVFTALNWNSTRVCNICCLRILFSFNNIKFHSLSISYTAKNLCPAMDGDRDRDPHWNTGLSSQGPVEEQKEGEHEQERQDCEGLVHPLRRCDSSKGSSPRPTGLGLNEHVLKLDSLNVADNGG
ncbi:hypothetical protein LEMLEM_LOCUS9947 [Lemmus lemmus]